MMIRLDGICCVCEKYFIANDKRVREYPESLSPLSCDECCSEIIMSAIEKQKQQIKSLKKQLNELKNDNSTFSTNTTE